METNGRKKSTEKIFPQSRWKLGPNISPWIFFNLQDLSLHTLTQRTQRFKSSKWYDIVVASMFISDQIRLDQSLSRIRLFVTPWIAARQASLSITNSRSSLRFTSIESVMPSSHLILCRPLLLLPPIPPSIRVFSNESTLCMRWPKYWSFSFSISSSNEHPGLISFRRDWLDLLAVQRTLKSLLQHHSSEASVLRPQPSSQHGTRWTDEEWLVKTFMAFLVKLQIL